MGGTKPVRNDPDSKGVRRLRRTRASSTADNLFEEERRPRKTQYTPVYYRRLRKQIARWVLVGLGLLVGGSHVITHLGSFQVLPSTGWQDLVMGYPMAGILVLAGIVLLST